jgi:hypothetical protein
MTITREEKQNKVKFSATTDGFSGGIIKALNAEITDKGYLTKRKGYKTFGEMVDVLWKINKQNKKVGFTCEYTVILPLKGTKPIYKKTLDSL